MSREDQHASADAGHSVQSEQPVSISTHQAANISSLQHEQYSQMNTEYLRRRYRRKYENPAKIRELLIEQTQIVENLKTATEGRMDVAVIGVLQSILVGLDSANHEGSSGKSSVDPGDRQRALFKANICNAIDTALRQLGGQPAICEKALQTVAYLCRYSDEIKTSVCLENAKAFGTLGICELIVGAIKRHKDDKKVINAACDAIRCMCALESNRERFGNAGGCEVMARAMVKYASDPEVICWICRAVGHLSNNSDSNRDMLGTAGACQSVILALQKFPGNLHLCTEACWAIRQLAPIEDNRSRFANDFAPESILAVYKTHMNSEAFAVEAVHALAHLIGSEDDDIIPRIAASGFTSLTFRSLKKFSDSEVFCRWVFNVLYYFACDDHMGPQLITSEVLKNLSDALQNHCTYEYMAEWGCRLVHKLVRFNDASERMRNAGINEMVTDAVQRQAISRVVSSVGCLALGDLATDKNNQSRLIESGACEAAVGALKRHIASVDVAYNSSYAIHHLCQTQNNVSWMGANGACEAVTAALNKHTSTSEEVARFGANALGSLAFKDEGNQLRLFHAGACAAIVDALTTHSTSASVVESTCRAIYNLCAEPQNVSELGKCGACGLVVTALQTHSSEADVVTQALYAIYGLAVKEKVDKVHKGNTRKLVDKGAMEIVVAVMQRFANIVSVQRAAGMAIASLGRLEANRQKLGSSGACELVANAIHMHINSSDVVSKLALAVDVLSTNSEVNKSKFNSLKVVDSLLTALSKHEKDAVMVSDCIRALIGLASVESMKRKIFTETTFRMFNKLMRLHEKNDSVAVWSCQLIYTASTTDDHRILMGTSRACETTVAVLLRHGEKNSSIAEWGCKAIVGLSLSDSNKERFHNPESCTALVKVLQNHNSNSVVAEWCTAAIVSIAVFSQNRVKLGSTGAAAAIAATLNHQAGSEVIVKLVSEAIYELAKDVTNQAGFKNVGINESLVAVLQTHINNAALSGDICRAIYSVANNNVDNSTKMAELGVCTIIAQGMKTHLFSSTFCQWSCAAVAALSGNNSQNQLTFSELGTIEAIAKLMRQHQNVAIVSTQATRAIRGLCTNNRENQKRAGKTDIVPQCMVLIKTHVLSEGVVEHASWIIGSIEYKPPRIIDADSLSRGSSVGQLEEVGRLTREESSEEDRSASPSDVAAPSPVTAKALYTGISNWDTLFTAMQAHHGKRNSLKWVCAAIAMFAECGKLSHPTICDMLVHLLTEHMESDTVVQKILYAIGSLARSNAENNQRLSHGGKLLEAIDEIIHGYFEGSAVIYGVLPAISGLAAGQSANQDTFNILPQVCQSIVKIVYNELETDLISQYGCAAVSALVENHPRNQSKLGPMCNYIADVLTTHKQSVTISTEACRTISHLAHKSITNRNRLGAADACSTLLLPANIFFNDHINASWWKIEHTLLYWTVRAIADLAANNPNNQAKLGYHGACDFLVRIMNERKAVPAEFEMEAKLFAYVFWAIGNLVQVGGKGASFDQVATKTDLSGASSHLPTGSSTSATVGTTTASAGSPTNTQASGAAAGGRPGLASNFGRQASMFVNNVASVASTGLSNKSLKNTTRFFNAELVTTFPQIMRRYADAPVTMIWACRAVTNLSKSGRLKTGFLDEGTLGIVQGIMEKYRGKPEVLEGATLARDILVATDD